MQMNSDNLKEVEIKKTEELENTENNSSITHNKYAPTSAYVMASWIVLMVGIITYMIGLYNAKMQLNEKGYYLTLLLFGLFAAVSLQKVVRDKNEGLPITSIYYGICWVALLSAIALMAIGLYNAGSIIRSEKGFYAMTYILCLFASITVQKNVRDLKSCEEDR